MSLTAKSGLAIQFFFWDFALETTFRMSISSWVLELKFQYWLHPKCQIEYNVYRHSALWCWNSTTKKLKTQPAGHTEYILQGVLIFLWFFLICMIVFYWNLASLEDQTPLHFKQKHHFYFVPRDVGSGGQRGGGYGHILGWSVNPNQGERIWLVTCPGS